LKNGVAPLGAFTLAFFLALSGNPAFAEDPNLQAIRQKLELCKSKKDSDISVYNYKEDGKSDLKDEYNGEKKCAVNSGNENVSHNAAAAAAAADFGRNQYGLFNYYTRAEDALKNRGACRASYLGIKEVYDQFAKLTDEYCDGLNVALDSASMCGNVSNACASEYKDLQDINTSYAKNIVTQKNATVKYFSVLNNATQNARGKYENDLKYLKLSQNSAVTDSTGDCNLQDHPEIKASNGNLNSCREYFSVLDPTPVPGASEAYRAKNLKTLYSGSRIILEESEAQDAVVAFAQKLSRHFEQSSGSATEMARTLKTAMEQADKNGSVKGNDLKKLTDDASGISGIAAGAKQALGSQSAGAITQAAAASSAAPIAEIAAAGAVGALTAHSFGGASQSSSAASNEAPATLGPAANSSGKPAVSSFDDHTAAAPEHAAGGQPPSENAVKGNVPKTEMEPGVNPGIANSDGSSRFMASKKPARTDSAPAASGPPETTGVQADDASGSFHQNLAPRPLPKPDSNPGGEVATLLGQMKNLFNFDEMAGGAPPGAPGAAPPALTSLPENGAPAPGMGLEMAGPSSEETSAGAPGGEAYANSRGTDESGSLLQSNPLGQVGISLFSRVRTRHQKCMERGLVLFGLKERVE